MATYDRHILQILNEVGMRGISVKSLVKHVYNLNNSLFAPPDIDEVTKCVRNYLARNSKSATSLIEHMERRGYYRLNTGNSATARQLMMDFYEADEDNAEEEEKEKPQQDFSLSLFD